MVYIFPQSNPITNLAVILQSQRLKHVLYICTLGRMQSSEKSKTVLGLLTGLDDTSSRLGTQACVVSLLAMAVAARAALILVPVVAVVLVFDVGDLDLRVRLAHRDGAILDVLVVHLLGGLEKVVGVAEADEAVALGLAGALVADDARLLHRRPPRKGLEQRVVGRLAAEVAHEEAQVRGVPLEERFVRPLLSAALTHDRLVGVGLRDRDLGGLGRLDRVAPGVSSVGVAGQVRALPLRNLRGHLGVVLGAAGSSRRGGGGGCGSGLRERISDLRCGAGGVAWLAIGLLSVALRGGTCLLLSVRVGRCAHAGCGAVWGRCGAILRLRAGGGSVRIRRVCGRRGGILVLLHARGRECRLEAAFAGRWSRGERACAWRWRVRHDEQDAERI